MNNKTNTTYSQHNNVIEICITHMFRCFSIIRDGFPKSFMCSKVGGLRAQQFVPNILSTVVKQD